METYTLVKDLASFLVALGMLCVAVTALTTWRRQLRGTTTHGIALRVATEAKVLSYLFFESRSPLIQGWEFPPTYYEIMGRPRTGQEEADGWRHVYNNRWKEVWPQILKLAHMRGEIGAVLGDKVADATEKLARVAKELQMWMEHDIEQRRVGPTIVSMWTDQTFVRRVKESVVMHVGEPTDRYSLEFIEARDRALALVAGHLK